MVWWLALSPYSKKVWDSNHGSNFCVLSTHVFPVHAGPLVSSLSPENMLVR